VTSVASEHVVWRADPLGVLDAVVAGIGGEPRDGQRALATAVAEAMAGGHHLLAEAPTGSGKSLAYLAPAVASGLRVVVATATIALQGQLVLKDLPALEAHGGVRFTSALLKGRANYVCRAKLRASAAPDALFEQPVGADFDRQHVRLRAFASRSETGDRAEFDHDVSNATWAAVSSTSVECPGRTECNDGPDCFAEKARDRAHGVSVLVVNHALYCAHLAADAPVLPEHDIVILDEAHAFPDTATNAFAGDVSGDALSRLSALLARAGAERDAVDGLAAAARALSGALAEREGRIDPGSDADLVGVLVQAAERLATAIGKLASGADDDAKRAARVAADRLDVLRRLAAPGADDVVWVEAMGRSRRVRIAPVAAGEALGHALLGARPVIAVSATLGGAVPFVAIATQIGLRPGAGVGSWGERADDGRRASAAGRGYAAVQTPSSFDWRAQGMLYVAKELPDPTRARDEWTERAGARICELVNAAGGRALVLCTSHANVKRFAELLRTRTDHHILEQGERDPGRLARDFVADETSVLVGTRSFWAGIDAVGAACVLVVIDRIPFPVPNEPLHEARRARVVARGDNPFVTVDLPAAALVLAQGAGRLLRTPSDRGVVAVLDPRLATKAYRAQLLAAMPPLRRSIDLDEACSFLADAAAST
jgi:ATP-dependent DNA helicase DinG